MLTSPQVIVAPFVVRFYACSNGDLMPKSFKEGMQKLPNFSKWADAIHKQESVMYVFDEKSIVERTTRRIAKMKEQAK